MSSSIWHRFYMHKWKKKKKCHVNNAEKNCKIFCATDLLDMNVNLWESWLVLNIYKWIPINSTDKVFNG